MTPEKRQRLLIRATLVAGMVLAGLGLVAVIQAKGAKGGAAAPALARQSLRVKVVDRHGRVVKGAQVFVKTASGAAPAQARWSPKDGTLMLPRRAQPHDLRVLARGFRVRDVTGVGDDRTIAVERGYRLRVRVRDVPESGVPENVRVMLRIRPLDVDAADPDGLSAERLVDLMDNLGGAGPKNIPRGDFGYPVSLAQARRGILLPRSGRYHVRWGLFHLRHGTWFTRGARCGRDVEIGPDADGAAVELVMTLDDLQATIDGLKRGIASAGGKR
ncbi:MAG: hypothetical protein QNJ90_12320 [Planctomycetota bacterium]|nr:hypothetical protein [Planctomycetota bacterium]